VAAIAAVLVVVLHYSTNYCYTAVYVLVEVVASGITAAVKSWLLAVAVLGQSEHTGACILFTVYSLVCFYI
jgi:hypothetical protein